MINEERRSDELKAMGFQFLVHCSEFIVTSSILHPAFKLTCHVDLRLGGRVSRARRA